MHDDEAEARVDPGRAGTGAPGRRGRARGVAVVAVLAIVAATGALAVARRAEPSADAALAAARRAVATTASYRFTLHTTETTRVDDGGGSPEEVVREQTVEGAVASPQRWHLTVADEQGRPTDAVRVGGDRYLRIPAHLDGEAAWVVDDQAGQASTATTHTPGRTGAAGPWEAAMRSGARLALAATGPSSAPPDPDRLLRAVTDLVDPEVVAHGADGTHLQGRLRSPAADGEGALPAVTATVELGADDRPRAVHLRGRDGDVTLVASLRFSDWGADVPVTAPAAADVDRTPHVDEEGLRAVDAELLVLPAEVPDGLVLRRAEVHAAAGDRCPIVDLEYGGEGPEAPGPYLWLTTYPVGCEDLGIGSDEPFDQRLGGLPARSGSGWEVRREGVVVSVDAGTDLAAGAEGGVDAETIASVVASLEPADAEEVVDAVEPRRR